MADKTPKEKRRDLSTASVSNATLQKTLGLTPSRKYFQNLVNGAVS